MPRTLLVRETGEAVEVATAQTEARHVLGDDDVVLVGAVDELGVLRSRAPTRWNWPSTRVADAARFHDLPIRGPSFVATGPDGEETDVDVPTLRRSLGLDRQVTSRRPWPPLRHGRRDPPAPPERRRSARSPSNHPYKTSTVRRRVAVLETPKKSDPVVKKTWKPVPGSGYRRVSAISGRPRRPGRSSSSRDAGGVFLRGRLGACAAGAGRSRWGRRESVRVSPLPLLHKVGADADALSERATFRPPHVHRGPGGSVAGVDDVVEDAIVHDARRRGHR